MYSIDHHYLSSAHGAVSRGLHRLGAYREKGAVVTQQAMQTLAVSAGAFGFSALAGWAGSVDVLGIPVDLGAGLLLNIAAYVGLGGSMSKNLHDLGDGALAAYVAKLGANVGDGLRRKHGGPHVKGERMLSSGERRRITPQELTAQVMASRA
jgi:hypothetical protein